MTEVAMEDGSTMETNLPAEAVADLQAETPKDQPADPKPEAQPASQTNDEQPPKAETETKIPEQEPQSEPAKREKPKPIAKLLEERHNLREENDKLKSELEKFSQGKPSEVTASNIQEILEKHGIDDANKDFINDLVAAIQKTVTPQLPEELNSLLAEHKANQMAKAEEQAFKADVGRLQTTLKDELLSKPDVQQKLQELAYSTDKAPDGEEFYKKPLYELYMNYVKPEVEPGRQSAEPLKGGSKAGGKVVDFAEIANDPAKLTEFAETATSEQFKKFHAWQLEHQQEPLRKPLIG